MVKVISMDSRASGESLGNIEINPVLRDFKTDFIDQTNNIILRTLKAILRTAVVPRVGRLPQEDLDWKGEIADFSRLRANYIEKMTVLNLRYSGMQGQPDKDKLNDYLNILKDFNPGILQNPDMETVVKALEDLMRKF